MMAFSLCTWYPNQTHALFSIFACYYTYVGRGKKKRKREKAKRAPTAYTLFVHENYETIKKARGDPEMASRDVIALVAQQWAETSEAEKQMWQFRAEQHEMKPSAAGNHVGSAFEEELPSLSAAVEEDGGGKKRARKQPTRGVSAVATAAAHHSVSV